MKKNLGWKLVIIIATLLVFVWGVLLGTDPVKSYQVIKEQGVLAGVQQNIHLGLDLKGGTHLVLQVKVADAINADSDQVIERLKQKFRDGNVNYTEIVKPDKQNAPERIEVRGIGANSLSDVRRIAKEQFTEYESSMSGDNCILTMKQQTMLQLKDRAVEQAIETIRNRIDQLGVSEPIIQSHGSNYQIVVELPGVGEDDKARIEDIMKSTAMLEIRQVLDGGKSYASEQDVLTAHNGVIPEGGEILAGHNVNGKDASGSDQYYLISAAAAVSGRDLRGAEPSRDESGQSAVSFTLTNEGGKKFQDFTKAHIGDYLAVVLDGKVQEVATIKGEIRDSGQISGSMDDQQAKDLALKLRSGALPASIEILGDNTVGPSLGADSIRQGLHAAMYGMLAVLVFMLIYYRGSGFNADLALILNLLILLGFLGFSGATLTLPGIAGLILTVGMGVDSNVLIFERIREELRSGKTAPSAVEQGFGHALWTIIDTHVTTIVSAAILFCFGTGPVKGFAVTLTFGLLANLFTAVFVSRVIFDWHLRNHQHGEALSI
jgi:preprotein translocase subunit SecD